MPGLRIPINGLTYFLRIYDHWPMDLMKQLSFEGGPYIFYESKTGNFYIGDNGKVMKSDDKEIKKALETIFSQASGW